MHRSYVARRNDLSSVLAIQVFFIAAVILFTPTSFLFAVEARLVSPLYWYNFNSDGTLYEANALTTSSPYWVLTSGAKMPMVGGIGMTAQGSLPTSDKWRLTYSANNPTDTDNGYHPQNIFRVISRSEWDNVRVESEFKINKDNFSSSPNRNASNGLLHMLRYVDQNNLYYVGIRVDGKAIIKKKKNGAYATLGDKKIYSGTYSGNSNLLPHNNWLSLKSEAITNSDGSVTIRLFVKNSGESAYTKVLEAKDASNPITGSGYVGMRTDFMDVEFDNFKATKL